MQISRNIVNGPKINNQIWGNLRYRLHPETISPLSADLSLYQHFLGLLCKVLFLDTALFLQVGSHPCRIKDSDNESHSFVKTALLTSDTSLNIWLALNTVILFLLVGLFELTRRYVQKTDIHK